MKYFLALWVLLGVIVLVRNWDRPGEIVNYDITQYEKTPVVGTILNRATLLNEEHKLSLTTSKGVNATIFLVSINSVNIKFQDEKKDRNIYRTYFIKSVEARQNVEKNLLFLKIVGAYMNRFNEWDGEEKIFLYDLSTRKLVAWTKIH